jgi:ribose 5-phosphate isomerase B
MKIAIGSDKAGFELKEAVLRHLAESPYEVIDVGPIDGEEMVSFVNNAAQVAERVTRGEVERGILICGTGMGMSLAANKHKGIYAAVVESVYTAKYARLINNANVLCMGGFIVAKKMAADIVDVFLETDFLQDFEQWRVDFLCTQMDALKKIEDQNFLKK